MVPGNSGRLTSELHYFALNEKWCSKGTGGNVRVKKDPRLSFIFFWSGFSGRMVAVASGMERMEFPEAKCREPAALGPRPFSEALFPQRSGGNVLRNLLYKPFPICCLSSISFSIKSLNFYGSRNSKLKWKWNSERCSYVPKESIKLIYCFKVKYFRVDIFSATNPIKIIVSLADLSKKTSCSKAIEPPSDS